MTGSTLFHVWRKSTGMSQAKLGAKLGVTQVAVCDWENDKRTPEKSMLRKIARLSKGAVPVDSWGGTADRLAARRESLKAAVQASKSEASH